MMQTLRCDDIRPQLGKWYDGEVAGAQAEAIGAHVADCPQCTGEVDALRAIDRLLTVDIDAADLTHRVVAAARREQRPGSGWWVRVAAAAAAALALGVFAGQGLTTSPFSAEPEAPQSEVFASLDEYFGPNANAGFDELANELGGRR
jgi:anti-sigma factor RsiW